MQIGIVGLGLIGGSMARALKAYTNHRVLAFDKNDNVMQAAVSEGTVAGVLTDEEVPNCDLILIALYPAAAVAYAKRHRKEIRKDALVMDLCGVKEAGAVPLTKIAQEEGFSYISAHPMAGTEKSGFWNARAEMFRGASMILIPCHTDAEGKAKTLAESISKEVGFAKITPSTIEEHDRIIAYTSQLCHVVSNAYVKSPTALLHHGFSAGSYRDLTRVAWLNEDMWTELFLDNCAPLADEIDGLIGRLAAYRDAIRDGNREELHALLKEGRERKERIDRSSNL